MDVLEGREGKAVTTANGEVVLDVRQLLQQLGDRLNLNLGTRIPEGAGQIVILDSDRLAAVQKAVRVIKVMTVFLVLVAFALIAGAVYLARGRRRETLRAAGIALLLVGIIDLVVRRLVGYEIVDALSNPTNESAVSATWDITSSLIVDVAIALIALGILGIVAAWIAGPTRSALWIRRKLAPTLRNRPVLVYAVVALALLLWLLFGPTQAVRSLIGTGIFIILVVVGVEVLRRQTAREFPAEPLAAEPVAAGSVAVPATPEPTGREPEEDEVTQVADGPSTVAERYEAGRVLRGDVPRSSHAGWEPPADRPDPIELLEEQAKTRLPELVPIRYGRMASSPFAFLRGSAAVMAADLARTPTSGLRVEACGDCHLMNFGIYATPERNLVFDLNDFDETLPAPFEWDVKRLAASIVVAARSAGFTRKQCAAAARACVASYRSKMLMYAPMAYLDIWYSRLDVDAISQEVTSERAAKRVAKTVAKARTRTSLGSLEKLTERVDGSLRIREAPPLIQHVDLPDLDEIVESALGQMKESLADHLNALLDRYHFVDIALKVVGVGSVGTRAFVVLMLGKGEHDPLFLQFKEAQASVLEPYAGESAYPHHGQRVVCGQRLTQAASDIFLGWVSGPRDDRIHYYFRQLRDMKGSFEPEGATPAGVTLYAEVCGSALARAHARSGGSASTISGYLGSRDSFDRAIVEFAERYADQTERDHAALVEAIRSGRIEAREGI